MAVQKYEINMATKTNASQWEESQPQRYFYERSPGEIRHSTMSLCEAEEDFSQDVTKKDNSGVTGRLQLL